MLQLPDPLVLHLQDGELLPVDGVRLRVEAGRVWVTRRDDLDDHFLNAGAAIELPRGCDALVGAEGAARVRLSGSARPSARPFAQFRQVTGNASWRQNPSGT
jgi:hypothetical protein